MKLGYLEATQTIIQDEFQTRQFTYKTKGGDYWILYLDALRSSGITRELKPGEHIRFGNLAFVVGEVSNWEQSVTVFKEKNPLLYAYFFILRPVQYWLILIYGRILRTLAIWDLAEVTLGEVPSLQWIIRRWKKK